MDDFGGAEIGNKDHQAYQSLVTIFVQAGVQEEPKKAIPPSSSITWLGHGLDAAAQTIFVILDRMLELQV